MCDEDIECRDEVSEWNGLVGQPLLVCVNVVDEDKEILALALVVDLGLYGGTTGHFD